MRVRAELRAYDGAARVSSSKVVTGEVPKGLSEPVFAFAVTLSRYKEIKERQATLLIETTRTILVGGGSGGSGAFTGSMRRSACRR
jgi:hypothetical protein